MDDLVTLGDCRFRFILSRNTMMGVGAVGNRGLCVFQVPCGRVLGVHRGGSVHALRRCAPLKSGRADLAECAMAAPLVIEHLDVIE